MKTWIKAIIGGAVGASIGACLGVVGTLLWFFWWSPPHFKNDSEAMGFQIILVAFGALYASVAAIIGMFLGAAIVWWQAQRPKLASAFCSLSAALIVPWFDYASASIALALLGVALFLWDCFSKRDASYPVN